MGVWRLAFDGAGQIRESYFSSSSAQKACKRLILKVPNTEGRTFLLARHFVLPMFNPALWMQI
jgi:hypothetical protein